MRLEINYTDEQGKKFSISRDVENDWCGMDEIEFLHDTYKAFLNTISYPVDSTDRIAILTENEYIEEYCDCDCGCENCEENTIGKDEEISIILKDHAKEISELVAEEFNKARSNFSWKSYISAT